MKSRGNVITYLLIVVAFLTIVDTNIVIGIGPTPLPPVEVNNLDISPDKISHQDTLPDITITLELPESYGIDDIADVNLILDPDPGKDDIEASSQKITEKNGIVTIIAVFDIANLMDNLSDYHGPVDLHVEGELKSGGLFYGDGTITIVQASDYISDIIFDQIWDYGDPTDSTDLMYEFRMKIYPGGSQAADMDDDILRIDFQKPAGQTFDILKKDNKWSNPLEYKVRSADRADLQDYGDGEYTITLHLGDGMQVQTTAWFGNPYTKRPIPQPTQEPVLTSELQQQPEGSLVTFNWEPCEDSSVDNIYINMLSTFNNGLGDKLSGFDFDQTSWGSILLLEGSWQTELIFSSFTPNGIHWWILNDDGISIGVAKSSKCRYRITVEGSPWNIYEVWGGNERLPSISNYRDIDTLEAYGYEKLKSDENNKFSGPFDHYLIATMGQCFIDSIQGSNDPLSPWVNWGDIINSDNVNNIIGVPDEQCAIVGSGRASGSGGAWIDSGYNGLFVFDDPNNWKNLTVYTSDRNLNLSKSIVRINDEVENLNPNNIAPDDTMTYGISFDTNTISLNLVDPNVYNIKIVDILSDHVIFEDAFPPDSNEVTGVYDPVEHTYTWQYTSRPPQTQIGHRLTVRVNPDTLPGTTITNFVTIDSDQTPPSIASTVAAIPFEPLNITKRTINSDGNDIDWIESGKRFIYQICFDNNSNGPQVENVILVDELPPELIFVAARDENENSIGDYHPQYHSYTVLMDALEPGLETCLNITVEVIEDTPNVFISNIVTIDSDETDPNLAEIDIEVIPPLEVADLIITPDILSRTGTSQYITAVVKFPAGIEQSDIDPGNIPELYYQDRDTGDFILIGSGSRPVRSGTQISTSFNRAELMDAIYGYGEFNLLVMGQLKSSLTFYGYENIHISKFTGD